MSQVDGTVYYLIFELTSCDLRRQIDIQQRLDCVWCLRVLNDVTLGGVAGLVGIEGGVVSGLSNPNDSGVATPVETTPCEAITRSRSPYIRKLRRAPNFFTTGSTQLKRASAIGCGALLRA